MGAYGLTHLFIKALPDLVKCTVLLPDEVHRAKWDISSEISIQLPSMAECLRWHVAIGQKKIWS